MARMIRHEWQKIQKLYWKHMATEWRRANHALRQTDDFYSRLIEDADNKGDEKQSGSLYGCRKLAAKYHVPEPEDDPKFWERQPYRGTIHLTVAGIDFIDARVYEKWKHRWEFWLLFAAAITGIIGAITGLISVLRTPN